MPANLRFDMYLACCTRNGIDVNVYVALHTVLDFAAVYDLIEMQQVQATWSEAARENAKLQYQMENPSAPRGPQPIARVGAKRRIRAARRGK